MNRLLHLCYASIDDSDDLLNRFTRSLNPSLNYLLDLMDTQLPIQLPESLNTILPFFHPTLMWVAVGLAGYSLYLGVKVRQARTATGEEKKEKPKLAQRHFQVASLFLVLIVLGMIGGMAVTYIQNGKLFVGPHLLAGLGMTGLVALSSALAPLMQRGQDWARNLHILINVSILGVLGWQAVTGVQIVAKILDQMTQSSVA